jgi:hypothetical protein
MKRAVSGIGVLLLGLALAMAPVVASPASAKTKHHKVVKHKVVVPTTLSGKDCTAFSGEQTQSTGLATKLEQAFATGNFATIKTAMLAEFTTEGQDVSKVEALLSGAPANVRAAFGTIAAAFNTLKTDIQNATSLTQLEGSLTTLGSNTQLESAGKVLASYFDSKCPGETPTT